LRVKVSLLLPGFYLYGNIYILAVACLETVLSLDALSYHS